MTDTVLIGGVWGSRDERLPVRNPADGTVVGEVDFPDVATATDDAVAACDAAAAAFDDWSGRTGRQRADVLLAAAARIEERAEELGVLLAREAGKRRPEGIAEIAFSAEYFRWFAEEARRVDGAVLPNEAPGRRQLVLRRATGVVASFTPWNFPCSIQARKLAPALAAGCTVVARVSEKAPLAVTELIRCLTDVGLPSGVVNLVQGPAEETTSAILAHPAVRVVSFTGSTGVGRSIMRRASERVVRPLLELGGDAPFLVFDDADVDAAVEGAMLGRFRNTGQSCVAANRFLVQDGVYDAFVEGFVRRIDAMTVGDGLADPVPDLGPVIDDDRRDAVDALIAEAVERGGRVLTRERDLPVVGSWVAPTLVADAPPDAGLASTEVFGPAAAVTRFSTEEEALALANRSELGLAAYAWTRDLGRAWRMTERLQAGIVGIDEALASVAFAPMGGVKLSGLGREGGHLGIEEFTDVHYGLMRL